MAGAGGAHPRVGAAVLAGGRSIRMGEDKRAVAVDGQPLLARVVAAVAGLTDDIQVVIADSADAATVHALLGDAGAPGQPATARVTVDQRSDGGPTAGLEAALDNTDRDLLVVVAADHPFLAPAVLHELVDRLHASPDRDAAALVTDRGAEPLVAVYRRRALARVRALLDAGERRATAVLAELDPLHLDDWGALDPSGRTTADIDTPSDLDELAPSSDVQEAATGTSAPTAAGRNLTGADEAVAAPGDRRARSVHVHRVRSGVVEVNQLDELVGEDPLELRAAGPGQPPRTVVTTLRTRGHDEDLAAGWLWSEGLLRPGGIVGFERGDPVLMAQPDDQLTVRLAHPLDLDARAERHATATASCGVCGRAAIDELAARAAPVPADAPAGAPLPWELLADLPDRLRSAQPLFARTGGLHATALATSTGELATLREDVGRHNALDAAIGAHIRAGEVALSGHIAVLSGRIGFELVAKVATAGIPVIVAVGAPTDLAVRTADRLGLTLIGFLRGGDGNVYTHAHRVALPATS